VEAAMISRVVSLTHNVLQIAEGGEYEVIMFNVAQMIIRSTTVQLTTTPPLLAMCCYTLFVLISCALAKII
jgi:hypothetical protein